MTPKELIAMIFCILLIPVSPMSAENGLESIHLDVPDITVIHHGGAREQAVGVLSDLYAILPAYRSEFSVLHTSTWPVYLDPSFTSPNGFVNFAYESSHWSMLPHTGISLGSRWHELLAVHEGRHMIQHEALDIGFSHAAQVVGGPYVKAIITSAAVPSWMFEGDAVVSETRFTDLGRGRISSFSDRFRQLLYERPDISWSDIANGSYLYLLPNHYVYGYYMMADMLQRYGEQGAAELFSHMGRYPVPLLAPTLALSSLQGSYMSPGRSFEQMRDELSAKITAEVDALHESPRTLVYQPWVRGSAEITAAAAAGDTLITVEYDLSRGVTLNHLDRTTGELWQRDFPSSSAVVSGDRILWYERRQGLLRDDEDHMALSVSDLRGDRKRDIFHGLFLGTADYRPSDQVYAAVVCDPSGISRIIVIDEDRKVLRSIGSEVMFFSDVIFGPSGELFAAADDQSGRMIVRIEEDGTCDTLVELGLNSLEGLYHDGERILFSSDRTGSEEIYALSLADGQLRQLTVSAFGVGLPFTDAEGELYCTGSESWDKSAVYRISSTGIPPMSVADTLSLDQRYLETLDLSQEVSDFESVEYHRAGALYPYRWGLYLGGDGSRPYLGVSWIEPLLELSLDFRAGYRFDEQELSYQGDVSFDGRFMDYAMQAELDHDISEDALTVGLTGLVSRQRDRSRYGVTSLNIWQAGAAYSGGRAYMLFSDLFRYGRAGGYRSQFALKPGLSVKTDAWILPVSGLEHAYQLQLTGYTGGPGRDDGFAVSSGLSWRSTAGFETLFDDMTALGYGDDELYGSEVSERLLFSSSLTYRFPIAYPELPMASLGKLLRIRGELYAGLSVGEYSSRGSVGCSLIADLNMFQRYQAVLPIGLGLTYRLHDERLLLSILVYDAKILVGDES